MYNLILFYKEIDFNSRLGSIFILRGEITAYTDIITTARQIATKRMVDEAESLGADAVINVRFGSSTVMGGAAEIIAYGTAVKIKKKK